MTPLLLAWLIIIPFNKIRRDLGLTPWTLLLGPILLPLIMVKIIQKLKREHQQHQQSMANLQTELQELHRLQTYQNQRLRSLQSSNTDVVLATINEPIPQWVEELRQKYIHNRHETNAIEEEFWNRK